MTFLLNFIFSKLFILLGTDTTTTTLTECIPTIVAAAELELSEENVVAPLVTNVDFSGGPGVTHQTPFVKRLTSETDDSMSATQQALDSTTNDETSPSAATVGVHGSAVQLKDIANLGSVDDMAVVAGQLIAQANTVRKDLDLVTLFTSFTTDQGAGNADWTPGDLYDAYGSLRTYFAKPPYFLVVHPLHIWMSKGIISLFDNSSDALKSFGPGSVGEEFTKYGYSGMVLGFNLFADANIVKTSGSGVGAAFARSAIKLVSKRGFMIEIDRDVDEVATTIVGNEIWGEAILRNKHGNGMSFDTAA